MVVADLHVHTTNSDGSLTLETLPAAAREAGIEAVAVTDHDRLHPGLEAPVTGRDGVGIIHGIELRVDSPAGRIDLLGYGVERTDPLTTELDRLQTDRIQRARAIVDCLEDRLGVALDVPLEPGVGRPHLARAVAESDADFGYTETFEELIGDGRPCYVAREVPDFDRGRDLLAGACGAVALAHPLRYDDPDTALGLAADLDGVERYYPYGRAVDTAPVEAAIDRHGLLATGGSDAHGDRLGVAGLDRSEYERVRALAGGG
jgi:predicted metal-dependent phosphoesterase TrpH